MALDEQLIGILADPETHEPLVRATPLDLEELQAAIDTGRARRKNGALIARVEGAFLSRDGRVAYLVEDGVPNFVIDERIELDART